MQCRTPADLPRSPGVRAGTDRSRARPPRERPVRQRRVRIVRLDLDGTPQWQHLVGQVEADLLEARNGTEVRVAQDEGTGRGRHYRTLPARRLGTPIASGLGAVGCARRGRRAPLGVARPRAVPGLQLQVVEGDAHLEDQGEADVGEEDAPRALKRTVAPLIPSTSIRSPRPRPARDPLDKC
jgi:hypothetical protein